MKILITGTHFTPAQAVISELLKDKTNKVVYLGRRYTREGDPSPSVESQVLPRMGVKFIPLAAGRLQRSFTLYTIPSLLRIPLGFVMSFINLVREKPEVVVSFGGYVGVPVVISAWLLSIPVVLHEQTLVSSLANRISALFADRIAISFSENDSFPQSKTVLTGNPVRTELIEEPKNISEDIKKFIQAAQLPLVFITGGNQGAHAINQAVKECLSELTKLGCVIHQTGDSKYQDYENLVVLTKGLEYPDRYLVKKWIEVEDLSLVLRKIDLAVSRAGVNTLQELTLFSVPTIIIPIANHYEQQKNARYFSQLGLAETLSPVKLSGDTLLVEIKKLLQKKRPVLNSDLVIIKDSAKRLALEIELVVKQNTPA